MQRNVLADYYPHALLALAATVSLCFVMSRPSISGPRPVHPTASLHEADADDPVEARYFDARIKTRSLAEVLENARLRYDLLRDKPSDSPDQTESQNIIPTIGETEITPRRMLSKQDTRSLAPAVKNTDVKNIGYVSATDPTLWGAPEALPQREYDILAYGEIGGAEPVAASRATDVSAEPVRETNQGTDTNSIFNAEVRGRDNLASSVGPAGPAVMPATTLPAERGVAEPTSVVSATVAASPVQAAPIAAAASHSATVNERTAAAIESIAPQQTQVHAGPMTAPAPASIDAVQPIAARADLVTKTNTESDRANPVKETTVAFAGKPADSRPGAQASTPVATSKIISPIKATPTQAANPTPKATDPFSRDRDDHTNQSLVMLIDGSDTLGSDKLNAIDNAIKQINQAAQKADLGIELKTTTDKSAGHNILLKEDNGKDMGNKLGLAEFTVTEDKHGNEMYLGESQADMGGVAKISINKAFDWFAGDDGKSIGKNQYDYQTAITHELLHMIGLDDDFDDLEAVSHGLLNSGEVRRNIDTHEIKELASIFQSANPWRSVSTLAQLPKNNGKVTYKSKALTAAVPEPASLALAVVGLLGACRHRRR
ncbi:MAG: PEP-CTERM sorting domain-containing protein [Phycisphaerales bacterium]